MLLQCISDSDSLSVESYYVVYAVGQENSELLFCILGNNSDYYPLWYNPSKFTIVDNRLSRYWTISIEDNTQYSGLLLSFNEWTNDKYFYTDLVDGKSENQRIFNAYRDKLDLEFPNPSVTQKATIIEGSWIMCSSCQEAWENTSYLDGMIKCPKCMTILHNPKYSPISQNTI